MRIPSECGIPLWCRDKFGAAEGSWVVDRRTVRHRKRKESHTALALWALALPLVVIGLAETTDGLR